MLEHEKKKEYDLPLDSQGNLRIPEKSRISKINLIEQETAQRGSRLSDCIIPNHGFLSKRDKK